MSQQLEEHFKLGVQACLKGFVKDANIQGNIFLATNYSKLTYVAIPIVNPDGSTLNYFESYFLLTTLEFRIDDGSE